MLNTRRHRTGDWRTSGVRAELSAGQRSCLPPHPGLPQSIFSRLCGLTEKDTAMPPAPMHVLSSSVSSTTCFTPDSHKSLPG